MKKDIFQFMLEDSYPMTSFAPLGIFNTRRSKNKCYNNYNNTRPIDILYFSGDSFDISL